MFINKKTGASYGFVAPEIEADNGKDVKVQFPTFEILRPDALGPENEVRIKVVRTNTLVDFGDVAPGAKVTLIAAGKGLPAGARLMTRFRVPQKEYKATLVVVDEEGNECAVLECTDGLSFCCELVWTGGMWQLLR